MTRPTLASVEEAFYADLLSVPFHKHLGIAMERTPSSGSPRLTIPPKPEIVTRDGWHSAGAMYTLGDAAAAAKLCEEVAPRALEQETGAIFLTVSARFVSHAAARGTIGAVASLVSGLDEAAGGSETIKKATVEVAAQVLNEDSRLVAEEQVRFYVRFMEPERMRAMLPSAPEVLRVLGS